MDEDVPQDEIYKRQIKYVLLKMDRNKRKNTGIQKSQVEK